MTTDQRCPRVAGILWRSHHWHYDGIQDLPIDGCEENGTYSRAVYHCCHCPERREELPYDY